ncbi:shikimate dehydrogenase (NADP(+)) [Acrocarpospora phusangensis]|uniref:Shikimate dehydrogenase (NADP(+)) n=1 Tax=Acrocarpospora phusangensis TaxID=1070424 RepID=A0A919QGZ4_9ACTN|nr:shikimate dehydrogenase [Acrocarpospora phusangensis]GIH28628.1 shikimate dehydrogenase (NADP(+)) [Acrocarpospora phusangensis]
MTSYLIGLIGSGIGPSWSPPLHEREAAFQGLRYLYRLIDIDVAGMAVGDLVRTARRFGFDGLNITHPCKQTVIGHLDELSPDAVALGAVNTVVFDGNRAIGHNTDWTGFAQSFTRGLPGAPTREVVQLGAGGAGAAVAYALLTLGVGRLTLVDAEPGRAAALATRLGDGRVTAAALADLPHLVRRADGLVHATPTGMAHHPGLPLPPDLLRPKLWVAEIVYRPLETELLREAALRGCRTLNGGGMVVFQAAEAFRLFTGREPDTERMLAHLTSLVAA